MPLPPVGFGMWDESYFGVAAFSPFAPLAHENQVRTVIPAMSSSSGETSIPSVPPNRVLQTLPPHRMSHSRSGSEVLAVVKVMTAVTAVSMSPCESSSPSVPWWVGDSQTVTCCSICANLNGAPPLRDPGLKAGWAPFLWPRLLSLYPYRRVK